MRQPLRVQLRAEARFFRLVGSVGEGNVTDMVVTCDSWGRLHLYECNQSRPEPLRSWHGFQSYQDLADFLTFGLRGPAPDLPPFPPELAQVQPFKGFEVTSERLDEILKDANEQRCVCGHLRDDHEPKADMGRCLIAGCACGPGCIHDGYVNEITKEGRRGEYSPRTDDGVPPPLTSCTCGSLPNVHDSGGPQNVGPVCPVHWSLR